MVKCAIISRGHSKHWGFPRGVCFHKLEWWTQNSQKSSRAEKDILLKWLRTSKKQQISRTTPNDRQGNKWLKEPISLEALHHEVKANDCQGILREHLCWPSSR